MVRKWSSVSKAVFGINIYEIANKMFPFEFSNRIMTEQIIRREWRTNNSEGMEMEEPIFSVTTFFCISYLCSTVHLFRLLFIFNLRRTVDFFELLSHI